MSKDFDEMNRVEQQFAGFEKNHPQAAAYLYFMLLFVGAMLLVMFL